MIAECTIEDKKVAYQSGDKYWDIILTGKAYMNEDNRKLVEFICICGKTYWGRLDSIKNNRIKSCGCRKSKFGTVGVSQRKIPKHGLCDHILYKTWDGMKQRCTNEETKAWKNYGGRGIPICDEWIDSPEVFIQWSLTNGWCRGLKIERKDNNKGYSPDNCKWASRHEQDRNKRTTVLITAFGETKCIADWYNDERCLVSKNEIAYRINKMGWDAETALTTKASKPKRSANGKFINGIFKD